MSRHDPLWTSWRSRWDRFQEAYVPYRETQLELMPEYVSLATGVSAVRALDLCAGPGSAGERLLDELPGAEVVAVDIDPWLLELGRQTSAHAERITWVEADLRGADWVDSLPHREFHAVLAVTAMHWFDPSEVERIYGEVAALLLPGGLFLTSDIVRSGTPEAQRLARAALSRRRHRHTAGAEDWRAFWAAVRSEPRFATLVEERDRRLGLPGPFEHSPLSFHEAALARAGFREIGEVWRCHENAMLLAIR
jgi:SAM-dependent methyltransferase